MALGRDAVRRRLDATPSATRRNQGRRRASPVGKVEHGAALRVDHLGQLAHAAQRVGARALAHLELRGLQVGVAVHDMEHVHQVGVGGAEHGHVVGRHRRDELVEQVDVLLAPAADGRVEAADLSGTNS